MFLSQIQDLKPLYEIHSQSQARRDECVAGLAKIENIKSRSDMFKLYNNVRTLFIQLDKEFIECRRRKKVTQMYYDLKAEFDEAVDNFDKFLIFALLLQ